jgi:cell division septation protein DedD
MKERVFYVVNLDKQRIGILSLFLFALFFSFFFLGVSVGKGKTDTNVIPSPSAQTQPEIVKAESLTPTEEGIPLPKAQNMEVPMADIASNVSTQANVTNPYYAESSTAKDEEEERKAQVIDLTKHTATSKKTETKHKELTLRNQSPVKEKKLAKKEVHSSEKLYTIQLGAFGTRDSAESFLAKVNQEKPKLKAFIIYKNNLFVVQMGKSSNKENLQKQLSKLKTETRSKAMVVSFIPLNR